MFGPVADLITPAYKGEAAALTLGNTQGVVVSIQRSPQIKFNETDCQTN
jgi:hypothetical protein